MAEYIEREQLPLRAEFTPLDDYANGWNDCLNVISEIPSADLVPVVHGKNLNEEWPSLFECSICHWSCWDTYCGDTDTYNYCPNCGARMDGEP